MNALDLTVPKIQSLFEIHNVLPIIGDWFGIGEGIKPPFITRDSILGADLTGILLLHYIDFDEALDLFYTPKTDNRRIINAYDKLDFDRIVAYWMTMGWQWLSCGTPSQYDYPHYCVGDKRQAAYKLGLSATKQIIGVEPEFRRAYYVGAIA